MSEAVLVIAIVVPAMLFGTLGVVGLVLGRRFFLSAKVGSEGTGFKAASDPGKSPTPRKKVTSKAGRWPRPVAIYGEKARRMPLSAEPEPC
jgi:hypothetical protein